MRTRICLNTVHRQLVFKKLTVFFVTKLGSEVFFSRNLISVVQQCNQVGADTNILLAPIIDIKQQMDSLGLSN